MPQFLLAAGISILVWSFNTNPNLPRDPYDIWYRDIWTL